jgi:hypothetical protein
MYSVQAVYCALTIAVRNAATAFARDEGTEPLEEITLTGTRIVRIQVQERPDWLSSGTGDCSYAIY